MRLSTRQNIVAGGVGMLVGILGTLYVCDKHFPRRDAVTQAVEAKDAQWTKAHLTASIVEHVTTLLRLRRDKVDDTIQIKEQALLGDLFVLQTSCSENELFDPDTIRTIALAARYDQEHPLLSPNDEVNRSLQSLFLKFRSRSTNGSNALIP